MENIMDTLCKLAIVSLFLLIFAKFISFLELRTPSVIELLTVIA